ncbi:hypothetical protein HYC85_001790 [Camellia sinensis]|uniref:Uncharacterized protein n=1 Tax=Camellia sinensis TaxID=4442 RepID=A0A7J7I7P6_CAMSI|nr:hypothetical protein HYC85_001790 [Camellia sinensis]
MLPSMLRHVNRVHKMCTEILGRTGGTLDPVKVHHVMSSNFPNFPKEPEFMKMFDVLGDGIFNSDADLWKNQRKLARVLINHQRFYRFLVKTSLGKVEMGLIPILNHVFEQGLIVDLQDLFQRFTFDTTCILITCYDPSCPSIEFPDVPFAKALLMRHVVLETVWRIQSWLGIGHKKKLSEAWKTLDRVINKYVSMKKEEMSKKDELKEGEEAVDLLTSYLIEEDTFNQAPFSKVPLDPLNLKTDPAFNLKRDDKFLRDTVLNLMLVGRDTTSSALTWFIWLVSQHPIVEEKIIEELKLVIPEGETEKSQLFEEKELSKLVYLHAALCESLRLYPPVPIQHKEPTQVDTLPTGHRWNLCGERIAWSSSQSDGYLTDEQSNMSHLTGPRTCLGKEVAFTQMKAVSAAIIHNYNVRVVKGHPVVPNASIILYMKHGLKVRVANRWI